MVIQPSLLIRKAIKNKFLIITNTALILLAIGVMYPFAWAIINSVKSNVDFNANPLGLPSVFRFQNYAEAWTIARVGLYMTNSVIIAVPTVIGVLIISVLGAFAFSFYEFRGKMFLYIYVVAGLAIPFQVVIIPLFFSLE